MKDSLKSGNARKLLILAVLVLLTAASSATSIESENIFIEVADDRVDAEIQVEELSSDQFAYITTSEVSSVNASIAGQLSECTIRSVALGSEIRCETDETENFTVDMTYTVAEGFVEESGSERIFRHQHPVFRPTEQYNLEVVLPEGTALAQEENMSQVVSPLGGSIDTTNGRQISVSWEKQPSLGETLNFYIIYEDFKPGESPDPNNIREIVIFILALIAVGLLAYIFRRRIERESISKALEDLEEEEMEVMELLIENDGEFLQKDVVDELDYSKAKVSGIVSGLVEEGYVKKTKEGRSNKLVIPKKYSV